MKYQYSLALHDLKISGNADTYYKEGITASLKQFGVTDATVIATYLSQPAVLYNAANYKESIGLQKWIAFYGQGLDAFAEWRRLDYPQLTAGVSTVLDGKMPSVSPSKSMPVFCPKPKREIS